MIERSLAKYWPREALGCRKVFDRCRYCSNPAEPFLHGHGHGHGSSHGWKKKSHQKSSSRCRQAVVWFGMIHLAGQSRSLHLRTSVQYVKVRVYDRYFHFIDSNSSSPFNYRILDTHLRSAYLSILSMSLAARGCFGVVLRKT